MIHLITLSISLRALILNVSYVHGRGTRSLNSVLHRELRLEVNQRSRCSVIVINLTTNIDAGQKTHAAHGTAVQRSELQVVTLAVEVLRPNVSDIQA